MTNGQDTTPARQINIKILVTGGTLVGVGVALGLIGVTLSGSVLLAAARRRVQQMDVPPRELAKQKWAQTKAATVAGVGAWHNGAKTHAHSS
jgi:hypothetical protein